MTEAMLCSRKCMKRYFTDYITRAEAAMRHESRLVPVAGLAKSVMLIKLFISILSSITDAYQGQDIIESQYRMHEAISTEQPFSSL